MSRRGFDQMLEDLHLARLRSLLEALIDQDAARVVVPPYKNAPGYWFGGGNIVRDPKGGLWLVGRYRNAGDSTTGLKAGERGLELAIFASEDGGESFEKVRTWSKADLARGERDVLSIEGAALYFPGAGGCALFVSSEKGASYPEEVCEYQKPGTGIWSIDVIEGGSVETLDAGAISPVFSEMPQPEYLHVKDPVVFATDEGYMILIFCSHPFCWTSSNSGYALRRADSDTFAVESWEMIQRGPAWDVAGTRITSRMPVPRVGVFSELPPASVYFYDGLECVLQLDQNPRGVKRPRGYSCEELGGACWGIDRDFPKMMRLSRLHPMFVSPYGTGCSRYVDTFVDKDGILATWQQGQEDGSQPLVGHRLIMDEVIRILS